MATEKVRVRIKFTRDYLYHNPSDDVLGTPGEVKRKKAGGTAGNDPDEWKKTYCATPEGQLYIKPEQVFACIREGGKRVKNGRSNISKDIAATLLVEEPRILFSEHVNGVDIPTNDYEAPVFIDKRTVKNPATKGLNMRYRLAVAAGAELEFHLTYDNTLLNEQLLEAATRDAFKFAGIGDGRGIGKGRAEVLEFALCEGDAPSGSTGSVSGNVSGAATAVVACIAGLMCRLIHAI